MSFAVSAAATGAGFLIEKLMEPLPAESMRERYPDDYHRRTPAPRPDPLSPAASYGSRQLALDLR